MDVDSEIVPLSQTTQTSTGPPQTLPSEIGPKVITAQSSALNAPRILVRSHEFSSELPAMKLDFDILLQVIFLLENSSDISKMMLTCRSLYQSGTPHLLRGDVIVRKGQLSSFSEFMLHDPAHRFRYLKSLRLTLQTEHTLNTPEVAKMLSLADCLETLVIHWQRPRSPRTNFYKRTVDAIVSLRSLRTLVMDEAIAVELMQVIENLQSPLQKVRMILLAPGIHDAVDPIVHFQRHKDSLEILEIAWGHFWSLEHTYPHLTTLTSDSTPPSFVMRALFAAYPRLSNLAIRWARLESQFRRSLDGLRNFHIGEHAQWGTWESLAHVRASILTVYILALRSKIEHLDLGVALFSAENDSGRLRQILSDTRPCALTLSVAIPEFEPSTLSDLLASGRDVISELCLQFNAHGEVNFDLMGMLENSFTGISSFTIKVLHVCVRWTYDSPFDDLSTCLHESACFEDQVHELYGSCPGSPLAVLDFDKLAREAMIRIPSLQHLCVTIGPRSGCEASCHWSVHGGLDGRKLTPLSLCDGNHPFQHSVLFRPFPTVM